MKDLEMTGGPAERLVWGALEVALTADGPARTSRRGSAPTIVGPKIGPRRNREVMLDVPDQV